MDASDQGMPQEQNAEAAPAEPLGGEEKKSSLRLILPIVAVVIVIAVIIWLAV